MSAIGFVGPPNVGKSTLFKACTNRMSVEIENRPFSTIEPNISIVFVPDPRLSELAQIVKPKKTTHAILKFVDIAGLVAGASKGEGLGNKFLAHIREVDAILHIVRCFVDPDIIHVMGKVDPIADIEIIHTELILADLQTIERALMNLKAAVKSGDKTAHMTATLLQQVRAHLDQGHLMQSLILDQEAHTLLKPFQFLTLKPMLYLANVHEDGFSNNLFLTALTEYIAKQNMIVMPVCAKLESELSELTAEERQEFLQTFSFTETILDRIIHTSYNLLQQSFFTVGVQEVRSWTIAKGASALEAAACIHTDFAKGFIRAEVVSYQDFIQHQGLPAAKKAGKLRLEGRDYRVQDGDIIHFLFNI